MSIIGKDYNLGGVVHDIIIDTLAIESFVQNRIALNDHFRASIITSALLFLPLLAIWPYVYPPSNSNHAVFSQVKGTTSPNPPSQLSTSTPDFCSDRSFQPRHRHLCLHLQSCTLWLGVLHACHCLVVFSHYD